MMYTMRLFSKMTFTLAFFLILNVNAQTELKVNAPFLPVGMINLAVEKSLNNLSSG